MLQTYEKEIKKIKKELMGIGKDVLAALELSFQGMQNEDMSALKNLDLSIKKISSKTHKIDNNIVKILALHTPEARDLREVIAFLKLTNELLRASVNTKVFAKTFRKSYSEELDTKTILELALSLHKSTRLAFESAINMLELEDKEQIEEQYKKVVIEEEKTDDLYAITQKDILKLVSNDIKNSKEYLDILSSFRKLESTADRAVCIANLLLFAKLGGEL